MLAENSINVREGVCREGFDYVARIKLGLRDAWIWRSLHILEKEVAFPRGYLAVLEVDNEIALCAKDLTSLRSLINTALRALRILIDLKVW